MHIPRRNKATHVFRWDLDKTYLRTEFDSMLDLVKSAMETASDKRAYPGATRLLRSLRQTEGHRICIISGSPTQMRRVLTAKLALDGVEHDEVVPMNNLRNVLRGRFRALRSQVPYKLPTLLASRAAIDGTPPETLFGDDAEADVLIYCLYADILAGKISNEQLERVLVAARAYPDEIERSLQLADQIERRDAVTRILIHLDRRSPTATFTRFGARVVAIFNYFQAALLLYADGVLSARQVLFVAADMLESEEHELSTLANSLQELIRRGRISTDVANKLATEASEAAASGALSQLPNLPPFEQIAEEFRERVRELGGAAALEWPDENPNVDYVSLVDAEHHKRRKNKKRSMSSW